MHLHSGLPGLGLFGRGAHKPNRRIGMARGHTTPAASTRLRGRSRQAPLRALAARPAAGARVVREELSGARGLELIRVALLACDLHGGAARPATVSGAPSYRAGDPGTIERCAVAFAPVADLVDRIQKEIDARLEELRPYAEEARDLQRALDAMSKRPSPGRDAPTQRRGRRRRARSPRGETVARVREYIAANPGSTAGEVASALALNRNTVATRLSQLAKRGALVKASRGYAAS